VVSLVQQTNADRALATYTAMQQALYASRETGLYRETTPSTGNPFAYVWPHSRALVGTLALAGMPDQLVQGLDVRAAVKDRLDALAWYWDGRAYASYVQPPYGGGGDHYSDDNTWLGLALVQAHRMGLSSGAAATGARRWFPLGFGRRERTEAAPSSPALRRAQQVFTYLLSNWDRSTSNPYPGGLFWVQQGAGFGQHNHDRGSGATAGAAELGLHLQQLTGTMSALVPEMLGWIERHLDASRSGVGPFLNAVRQDASVDTNLWSYNQGVMVGAYVLLHRLDRASAHLQRAEAIARQSLATFGDFTTQPPSFNAMYFQNLLMLFAETQDRELQNAIVARMAGYADWAWAEATRARDPKTNLFYFTDAGAPNLDAQPARLQDQGAMLQLYALLAWDPSQDVHLT
jgi:hypothetical protein